MATCDCFSGTPASDQYKPAGFFSSIAGLTVYESAPRHSSTSAYRGDLLYLPDGSGLSVHNLRLADMYAAHGFKTTVVDYFEGDALPDIFMKYTPGTDVDSYVNFTSEQKEALRRIHMPSWLERHNQVHLWWLIELFFPEYCQKINAYHVELGGDDLDHLPLHVLGHGFGGKYAFKLAKSRYCDGIRSALIFHPSFVEQSDTEGLKRPVFVGCAETDMFAPNLIYDMSSQLPASGTIYKLLVYGGTKHGFATRAEPDDKVAMFMFKQAFDDGLGWLVSTA